ncbi:MAG: hypothetical protein ACE5KJ_05710, partial [Candidatus Zixiibacteriota bacterium]
RSKQATDKDIHDLPGRKQVTENPYGCIRKWGNSSSNLMLTEKIRRNILKTSKESYMGEEIIRMNAPASAK